MISYDFHVAIDWKNPSEATYPSNCQVPSWLSKRGTGCLLLELSTDHGIKSSAPLGRWNVGATSARVASSCDISWRIPEDSSIRNSWLSTQIGSSRRAGARFSKSSIFYICKLRNSVWDWTLLDHMSLQIVNQFSRFSSNFYGSGGSSQSKLL